ncbi:dnaJ homolog subfamily C member 7 homolog [Momordica charantia]|uniref:DnaJ homolog subfamily C member 7 homolog n=1 Tax=Momordica charantia TaxID=3673 RepID=A0A6J1DWY6_MOMCH|nr:dnaJ homolog subfamily C member 7 homolog [Momordica charantia]
MMNGGGIKTALLNSKTDCFGFRTAFFHSTPVLDRKRRNHWDSRCNHYTKSYRRINAKQTLLRNVSAYADFLFQSWHDESEANDPSSSRGTSWFKRQYSLRGSKRDRTNQRPRCWSRNFEFTEDDPDVETVFRSAFGGNRFYYWSFINEENPQWRSSTNYSNNYGRSWSWRNRVDEDYDDSSNEYEDSEANLVTHRLALGLTASGPLKLEDVKKAYRTCALKWHPDRHQGSSKAVAEEKFKLCSVAYQSLCDKLAVN